MSTVRFSNEELRRLKPRVDHAKIAAATEEQIEAWKRADDLADDEGILDAVRFVPPLVNVGELRERLKLSQEAFADRYFLSVRTIQDWEQRRREPSEAARVLLYAISRDAEAVARLLRPDAA